MSIFGVRLGPESPATASLDAGGRFPTELAGVKVLFDGVPAPLIFATAGQVSAIVPYVFETGWRVSDAGLEVARVGDVAIEYNGLLSDPIPGITGPSAPGIFTADASGSGQAAALNQDGSINSAANPAAQGSVVVLYGTGAGEMTPTPQDGALIGEELPIPTLPVSATVNGQDAEILYAGGAPGLVAGVLQVNLRLPPTVSRDVQVVLTVGPRSSQTVTVAVAP
jgi:uncharacterized protein (TIGR03437 family)